MLESLVQSGPRLHMLICSCTVSELEGASRSGMFPLLLLLRLYCQCPAMVPRKSWGVMVFIRAGASCFGSLVKARLRWGTFEELPRE